MLVSPEEDLARIKENTERDVSRFRMPDQAELADEEARVGRPIHYTEFIRRVLKLIGTSYWMEPSRNWPGGANFYTTRDGQKVCMNTPFQLDVLPEYTIIHEDADKLPGKRTVGWREVLYRLLRQNVLTKAQIDIHFGLPTATPNTRWQKLTREF